MDQTRTIPLTRGYTAIVDAADYPALAVHKWQAKIVKTTSTSVGHVCAVRSIHSGKTKRQVYMHREIMGAKTGQIIDHANRDALDNRRINLRFCTTSGNTANRVYPNPLGFRGVYAANGRFGFQISAGRKNGRKVVRQCGFATAEEAARAYDAAAQRLHGEFAVLNFPTDPSSASNDNHNPAPLQSSRFVA